MIILIRNIYDFFIICDGLPCCHRRGARFGSLRQDKRYVSSTNFEICIQNCLPPSRGPDHIHISLSTLDTSIHFFTYSMLRYHLKMLAGRYKIKESCFYLAVSSFDIEWWFCDTNLLIYTPLNLIPNLTKKLQIQSKCQLPSFFVISCPEGTTLRDKNPETNIQFFA